MKKLGYNPYFRTILVRTLSAYQINHHTCI